MSDRYTSKDVHSLCERMHDAGMPLDVMAWSPDGRGKRYEITLDGRTLGVWFGAREAWYALRAIQAGAEWGAK